MIKRSNTSCCIYSTNARYKLIFRYENGTYRNLELKDKLFILQQDVQANLELARQGESGWDAKLRDRGLSWDSLDEPYKLALMDLAYNVGGNKAGTWNDIFDTITKQGDNEPYIYDKAQFVNELRRQDAGNYTAGMDNRVTKIAHSVGLIGSLQEAKDIGLKFANTTEIPEY